MIPLDDVVLRDDLDPRLGDRDDDLIEQYADIFDALPPIEINQHNEVIDGWYRYLAARRAGVTEIAYVVVATKNDDDLSDRMWESNLRHGVQYTRGQRQTHGLKLHERSLKAKEIAERIGVGASSVYRWTKELREKQKEERDAEIQRLREKGMTTREIAEEVDVDHTTVAAVLENSQMRKNQQEPESEAEPAIEPLKAEAREELETAEPEDALVAGKAETREPESESPSEEEREYLQPEPETGDVPAEEEAVIPEPEPPSPPEELLEIVPEPEAATQSQEPELPEDIFAFTAPLGFLGTLSVRWQSAVKSKLGDKHRRGNDETSD